MNPNEPHHLFHLEPLKFESHFSMKPGQNTGISDFSTLPLPELNFGLSQSKPKTKQQKPKTKQRRPKHQKRPKTHKQRM